MTGRNEDEPIIVLNEDSGVRANCKKNWKLAVACTKRHEAIANHDLWRVVPSQTQCCNTVLVAMQPVRTMGTIFGAIFDSKNRAATSEGAQCPFTLLGLDFESAFGSFLGAEIGWQYRFGQ